MPIVASPMRLNHIAAAAFKYLLGRLIWHALIAFVFILFAMAALYHYSIAGLLTLELHYGALLARVIIGTIYAAMALMALGGLWVHRRTNIALSSKTATTPHELQIVMLIEAIMLGYELARKRGRIRQAKN
jgi:hypothetical protein